MTALYVVDFILSMALKLVLLLLLCRALLRFDRLLAFTSRPAEPLPSPPPVAPVTVHEAPAPALPEAVDETAYIIQCANCQNEILDEGKRVVQNGKVTDLYTCTRCGYPVAVEIEDHS